MYFKKICPICIKPFLAVKINALYCSKKCNNRSRSIPEGLLKGLIKNVSVHTMSVKDYQQSVMNDEDAVEVNVTVKPTNDLSALGSDKDFLLGLAKMDAQNRRDKLILEEKEKQKSLESDSGFSVVESPADMSTEALQAGATAEIINIEPKKYKIRPIRG
jgi:hypothetical protein